MPVFATTSRSFRWTRRRTRCSGLARTTRSTVTTLHRASGLRINWMPPESRWCAQAMGASITARSWERLRTRSWLPNSRALLLRVFQMTQLIRVQAAVSFRPTRFWSMVPSSTRSFSISGFRQERASATRGRRLRFAEPPAAVRASVHARLRTRTGVSARRPCGLRSYCQQADVPFAQPQSHGACGHDSHRRHHQGRCVWRTGRTV